jgi:hypothetical protein
MKLIVRIALVPLVFVFVWLLFGFVSWQLNPAHWTELWRAIYIWASLICAFVAVAFPWEGMKP